MTDGVVRAPSLFSITLVVLPSMMATHEFVVPRSIPMIFAMSCSPDIWKLLVFELWISRRFSRATQSLDRSGRGHRDQRRAQHTVGDVVALLQHRDHGIG